MENIDHYTLFSAIVMAIILIQVFISAARNNKLKSLFFGLVIWVTIVLTIVTGYAFRSELNYGYQRVLAVLAPSSSWVNSAGEIVIARHRDGHFYLNTVINGVPITFMIDTGASDIALTKKDAKKLGIDLAALKFTKRYSTANGFNYAAPVILRNVKVGDKIFHDVKGHIGQGDLDISLFGMSAIEGFKGFKIDRDMLVLSY